MNSIGATLRCAGSLSVMRTQQKRSVRGRDGGWECWWLLKREARAAGEFGGSCQKSSSESPSTCKARKAAAGGTKKWPRFAFSMKNFRAAQESVEEVIWAQRLQIRGGKHLQAKSFFAVLYENRWRAG